MTRGAAAMDGLRSGMTFCPDLTGGDAAVEEAGLEPFWAQVGPDVDLLTAAVPAAALA